jgi:hypothetical protein
MEKDWNFKMQKSLGLGNFPVQTVIDTYFILKT